MNNQFHKLFVDELKDLLDAEEQIRDSLPKMIDATSNRQLTIALQEHLDKTENHVTRLEEVLESLGEEAVGKKCKGVSGIISEGEQLLNEDVEPDVLDAAIIMASQKVEHYEIATYGTVVTWAKLMGLDEQADMLAETLDDEEKADKLLSKIAKREVNKDAGENPLPLSV